MLHSQRFFHFLCCLYKDFQRGRSGTYLSEDVLRTLPYGRASALHQIPGSPFYSLKQGSCIVIPAELVNTVDECFIMAVCFREAFHTPAGAASGRDARSMVVGNAPVGTDHAVKTIFFPQKVVNQVMIVGVAYCSLHWSSASRNRIVGHDGCGSFCRAVKLKSAFGEWL